MDFLWIIPALPLSGFVVLTLAGGRMPRGLVSVVGVGSIGLAALTAVVTALRFLGPLQEQADFSQTLWTWVAVADLELGVTFYLDAFALIMVLVITVVGFLIHLYATGYMAQDPGYSRFFAYMNLFVAAMLILVLADNLLLLYLGWEGVGLCSYLLIGFWQAEPANGYAARKAFMVTRVGDTAMAVGLFILYSQLNTLQIQELMSRAAVAWPVGSALPTAVALLLLGGSVGKSAQIPLQTWLPDAMVGPTPVSALIHAATMVTAGVYLIARTHVLFLLAPAVLTLVAVVGALTLLSAGFSALVQQDIKRVLAYSTMSQLGYMFLALGVGAWTAAVFHLVTHAFFKALLFLGAGAIIHALGGEQNLSRMGGLRRQLPLTFWTFLIGAAALAALPMVTAGFYSKDLILWTAFAGVRGELWLWAAGLAGALLTSLYTFRMVFLTFAGPVRTPLQHPPGLSMTLPLVALAVLSLVAGFIETPDVLGGVHWFSRIMQSALPEMQWVENRERYEGLLMLVSGGVVLIGLVLAYGFVGRGSRPEPDPSAPGGRLITLWFNGWGVDRLYDRLFVQPYVFLAHLNRDDMVDRFFDLLARIGCVAHKSLSLLQTGQTRVYAAGIGIGAMALIALVVLL